MKVTLHEVAARAEVSIATVSRALNGLPVSKASAERVALAAAELGYVANEAARALRSERTMTMGLVFADLRNVLGIELLDALSDAIEAAGYSLVIATARGDDDRYDVLMRRFLERRVDAVFCIGPKGAGTSLALYRSANIPVLAMFAAAGPYADLPLISPTFSEPARALAEHLKGLGHERIAVLQPETGSAPASAVADELKGAGLAVEKLEISRTGGLRDTLQVLLAGPKRPTAVVTPDPAIRALVSVCRALGVRVPEDLSLISLSDITAEAWHRKHALSSITIDPHRMGGAAGTAMLAWLSGTAPAQRVRLQVAAFTPRASSGPAIA